MPINCAAVESSRPRASWSQNEVRASQQVAGLLTTSDHAGEHARGLIRMPSTS